MELLRESIPLNPNQMSSTQSGRELQDKIRARTAQAGVVGLGYVGLPLALEMAQAGFQVTGIDLVREKVDLINAGISYIPDVASETVRGAVAANKIKATQSLAAAEKLDTLNICVPTPLRKNKDPDLSYVLAAVEAIRNHIRPGQLITLESTTYPGTTREMVLPILEDSGLKVGRDFFLAYSPERVDPGNQQFTTRNIPKVVGGATPRCTKMATLFYEQFVEQILPVSSTDCAEMVKLLKKYVSQRQHRSRQRDGADAIAWASMSGKLSRQPSPSRSVSCRFIPGPD